MDAQRQQMRVVPTSDNLGVKLLWRYMVTAEFPDEGFPAQITDSRPFAQAGPRVRLVLWQVKRQRVPVDLPPFTALDGLKIGFLENRRVRPSVDQTATYSR